MKILILGAGGYIGSSLAKTFLTAGYSVFGFVRNEKKADALFQMGITPFLGKLED